MIPSGDRVHKISIIPRGRSLGATQLLPEEDRVNISESELHARLAFLLGGRAAEKLMFNEYSAGAEDDLKRATQLARRMVAHWGMSERLGPVAFRAGEEHPFLGKEMSEPREFSDHTAQLIDEEIVRILRAAEERAEQLLGQHRDKLDKLASALEREEVLDEQQIADLVGPATCADGTERQTQAARIAADGKAVVDGKAALDGTAAVDGKAVVEPQAPKMPKLESGNV
jgi:cell division protease FtsH